jgi:hypothetical protein
MSGRFQLYDRVRVVSDRFADENAPVGTLGYIIEEYDDGAYEVEVSNPATGETIAQFAARPDDLQPAPES